MARAGGNSSDKQNSLICANLLLSRFADVNQANHEGETPLIAGSFNNLHNLQLTTYTTNLTQLLTNN